MGSQLPPEALDVAHRWLLPHPLNTSRSIRLLPKLELQMLLRCMPDLSWKLGDDSVRQ